MKPSEEPSSLASNDGDEHFYNCREENESPQAGLVNAKANMNIGNSSTNLVDDLVPADKQTTWKKCVSSDQVPYYIETSSVPLVTSWRQPPDDPEADPPEHISGSGPWRCCEDFPHCGCSRGCQVSRTEAVYHVLGCSLFLLFVLEFLMADHFTSQERPCSLVGPIIEYDLWS